jgi:hypothetical protein
MPAIRTNFGEWKPDLRRPVLRDECNSGAKVRMDNPLAFFACQKDHGQLLELGKVRSMMDEQT